MLNNTIIIIIVLFNTNVADQLNSYYSPLRKSRKWYRKLALEMIVGISVTNAQILHNKYCSAKQVCLKNLHRVGNPFSYEKHSWGNCKIREENLWYIRFKKRTHSSGSRWTKETHPEAMQKMLRKDITVWGIQGGLKQG